MHGNFLIIPILLPLLVGVFLPLLPFRTRRQREFYIEGFVLLNTVLVFLLLFPRPQESFTLFYFTGNLSVTLHLDGMGSVFAGLLSSLWPLATLYSFAYMEKEGKKRSAIFFAFYIMTYGIALGIAFSGNLLTLYMFYELLTLVTVPLVIYSFQHKNIQAANKYLRYSLGGAAFAFIGLIFILTYGNTLDFQFGGVLELSKIGDKKNTLLLIYVLTCCGFGVKSALFPFHGWLPTASVAPTPVTALLHAVAVVKAGAFAIMRITYFSFGVDFLKGTWAQYVMLTIALVTILFGSSMAVKEVHLKRRLAYSTISNLSYIIFSVMIMTPLGFIAALTHMVFHGLMKICSFFCIGAVMHQTEKEYVREVDGLAKQMPITFGCFTIAALALIGVPPLTGFTSKWNIATAAASSQNIMAYCGVGVLFISSVLTAIYMLTIVVRAFFSNPEREEGIEQIGQEVTKGGQKKRLTGNSYQDPKVSMTLPLLLFASAIVFFGVYATPLLQFFEKVARGIG